LHESGETAAGNREDAITDRQTLSRRQAIAAGATSAAVLGAGEVAAQTGPKTPFTLAQTTIPIAGSTDVFPVRRIYCIGRNYAAHAREMGSDPTREPPFFFQ
jgi:fumarylpyruvate hydrolase